jgi:hypothetical protein
MWRTADGSAIESASVNRLVEHYIEHFGMAGVWHNTHG